jgi:hypothetical protein
MPGKLLCRAVKIPGQPLPPEVQRTKETALLCVKYRRAETREACEGVSHAIQCRDGKKRLSKGEGHALDRGKAYPETGKGPWTLHAGKKVDLLPLNPRKFGKRVNSVKKKLGMAFPGIRVKRKDALFRRNSNGKRLTGRVYRKYIQFST